MTASDDGPDPAAQRAAVRERYGRIASDSGSCCGAGEDDGCGDEAATAADDASAEYARALGYDDADLDAADVAAELGLGCGNPTAIADLESGQTVLDLGAGAGFDCFLAAEAVGPSGRVIGVDMTPEMVERAREHAAERDGRDAASVEFRLGEIEHLPVPDATVDVILSNCVVNLSPDKPRVFAESHRVLRPGGRLAISDVVLTAEPPADLAADPESVAACVGGASSIPALEATLEEAGFVDVAIEPDDGSETIVGEWDDEYDLAEYLASATIEGRKPAI